MSAERKELQEALCCYTADTLIYIDTVRGFCERISKWMLGRKSELDMMKDIKERATKINRNMAKLEKKLAAVLKYTLRGLEELDRFLDAVEKLAVTSLHVFTEENQVLHLPEGIIPEQVQVVIAAARLICPLLLEFKRDASVFFLPKLQNVEVLSYQLDKYIQTTQKICDKLEKSSFSDFSLKMVMNTVVDLDDDLSEDDIQRMLQHIKQLDEIRKNKNFRMVFLFQEESGSCFIDEFCKRQPRMLQFLNDLEECAVQLDRMNKGAKISSVAGSSVGAVGGVLSIVGLALIPVTAGVSLALTLTGAGLGVTSAVNSLVTTATEIGVNCTQRNKASETFQSFMENVQILQGCLDEMTSQEVINIEASGIDVAVGVGKVLWKARDVKKGVGKLTEQGKALRNVPKLASDIPDIGQAAVKGPLALSKSATAGLISALFLGMDIFFICKDSYSLYQGSETKVSQFIRARSALWSSEIDSWQKICDSLLEGQPTSENNKVILETPFYPEKKMKKEKETEKEQETEMEIPFDDVDKKQKKQKKQRKRRCVIQ